jgi:hypothetical protein
MEVGGKRHALAALPPPPPPPGKSHRTPWTEGRVGLLMTRYTNTAIPTAQTSTLIYHIYYVWLNSRPDKPIHNTA